MSTQLDLFDTPTRPASLATYDWIVISSSAGKDSLAMLSLVAREAETAGVLDRVVVVHADLGRVEWSGTRELAEKQAVHFGVRFVVVWRKQGDLLQQVENRGMWPGPSTRFCTAHHKSNQVGRVLTALTNEAAKKQQGDLLTQVEERGMWPDSKRRYCTSDQKRDQIKRVFTALTNESVGNTQLEQRKVRILSCMGMRADESPKRAKKRPYVESSPEESNGRRQVDTWLPLHSWTETKLWQYLREEVPADLIHYAYGLGMPRVSCCFCIFAPREALILAGHHNPELLAEYARIEKKIGHKFRQNLSMADVAEAVAAGERPKEVTGWQM